MASKLLLWASVLCTVPSVMGLHRLDRLRSSILDMSTDTNAAGAGAGLVDHNTNAVEMNANVDVDLDLYAEVDTQTAAGVQRMATQLNQEMYQHLMRSATQQELEVDAVYNEKRIGVEVEYQGIPRVVVAVKPEKIAAMKAQFTGTGKYAALGAARWIDASSVPLRYGNSWLVTKEDGQGLPYWKATTDNEDRDPTANEKNFWKQVIGSYTSATYGTPLAEAIDDAEESMQQFCGLNAAMELVTLPLETSSAFNKEPNYVFVMQAMRIFTATLRRFTYKSTNNGADGGLGHDSFLASALSADHKLVICKAMGGDITNFDTAQGQWLGQSQHYVVPLGKIIETFQATLTQMNGNGKPWNGILKYDIFRRYTEGFLWASPASFPFTYEGAAEPFYERYFLFPVLNAAATNTEQKMRQQFRFGPQLNFGFPVSRFGAADSDTTIAALQQSYDNIYDGYYPFTSTIWRWVLRYGARLNQAVIDANAAQWPGRRLPTPAQAADVKGFMTLFLHYYFIEGFLGLRSDKFAHSLLLKAPLNDVLRSLNHRSRRVIASWWDSFKNVNACYKKVEKAAALIYTKSGILGMGYPIPWGTLSDSKKNKRIAAAKAFITSIFESITTDSRSRWKNERARVITGGVVTTPTRYGELNAGNDDEKPYPAGRKAVSPVAKTVPPFYITAGGVKRPAVLLEHRDGDMISSEFGDVWVDPTTHASPAALSTAMDVRINKLAAIQTPVLLEEASSSHAWPNDDTKGDSLSKRDYAAYKLVKEIRAEAKKDDDPSFQMKLDDTPLNVAAAAKKKALTTSKPQQDVKKLLDADQENPFAWDSKDKEDETLQADQKKLATQISQQCEALLKKQAAKQVLDEADIEELQEDCGLEKQ